MKKVSFLTSFILIFSCRVLSQVGGDNTYEFLNLSTNSLISSLGGMNVSLISDDPGLAYYNPALLSKSSSDMISLNYVNYLSGINYGYASYTSHIEKYGTFSAGLTYLNYGKFDEADPTGLITGTFRAAEYALNLIWSYNIDTLFHIGVNVKPVISHLDRYTSVGLLMDIGGLYQSKDGLFSTGLTIRNIGTQLSSYSGIREKVPFEIVAGASLRLKHAPFRFSLTARHLHRYNLIHDSELSLENSGEKYQGFSGVAENMMRHLIFSAEFLPTENFFLSTSYNYLRRKELMVPARTSTVGFSIGAGLKLSRMEFSISRSKYHLAGSLTNISLLLKPELFKAWN